MEERGTLVVNESASVEESGRKTFFEVPSSPWWDVMDIYEVDFVSLLAHSLRKLQRTAAT
jgi:hypothetical protein